MSCYGLGYPNSSKCQKFYYATHGTVVVESINAEFFEDIENTNNLPSKYVSKPH